MCHWNMDKVIDFLKVEGAFLLFLIETSLISKERRNCSLIHPFLVSFQNKDLKSVQTPLPAHPSQFLKSICWR